MGIKHHFPSSSAVLKSHINRYAIIGLLISIASILVATCLVAYQMTGEITLRSFLLAQRSNPAIWALNLTPFMFAYWGQAFCYGLADKAESILEDKAQAYKSASSDLKLKLEYETNHDSLTQLPNRHLLTAKIDQAIPQIQAYQLALIIININDFKNISYNVGVFNSNSILKQFAEKLKSILLEPFLLHSYTGMNLVARLQGDEFAILLPRLGTDVNLQATISNIHRLTSTDYMAEGLNIHMTTTIGAAVYPEHGKNAEELIHHASVSAYNARREAKDYAIYDPKMREDYSHNRILLAELQSALANDQLEVYYQPVIQLKTKKVIAAEASVHLHSDKLGSMSAERMIPLIEGTNLAAKWTELLLEKSLRQIAGWHKAGFKIHLNLRLSASDLNHPKLADTIEQKLKNNQLSPRYLSLELSERTCLAAQPQSFDTLNLLSAMGIKICIEDFCSGHSSFMYLSNFPISEVKIDKSLTSNIMQDEKKFKMVKAMLSVAKVFSLQTQACGVNDRNIDKLKELGCNYGQGLPYSQPVEARRFEQLFDSEWLTPAEKS